MLLLHLRGKIISYSAYKKKQNEKKEKDVEDKIDNLEYEVQNNLSQENFEKLEKECEELKNLREEKIEGLRIRSRARWHELGEKSTSYFLNLENRNFVNKTIQELKTEQGTTVTNIKDILNEQKNFYENLYSDKQLNDNVDITETLQECNYNTLSEENKQKLEGEITYKELLSVLKKSKNNKSPGLDGYTSEFFKFFWIDIGYFLLRSINYAYQNGELSLTQKQGVITCIPKTGKQRCFLKNWRPISLLNVSYKLASSCIAERLKTVLDILIHEDQKGFITGRYIGENTRLVYDLMHETKLRNIGGIILLIDCEKAFDTVSWQFINSVLDIFNFGSSIKKWISLFYKNANSCVIQNGFLSAFFNLGRGCRQGDPLSPYIFLLCAEILGIMIRNNKDIKGIKLLNKEFKISQYADDTSVFLDASETSLKTTLNILEIFYNLSGLKANLDKTKAMWIGSMSGSDLKLCMEQKLQWVNEFTLLGINFNNDLDNICELNFREKINEIKRCIKLWTWRSLTLMGKITVVKSLLLSKLIHLFLALPNPSDAILKEIETIIFKFIWNKKPDKIKRNMIYRNIDEGGLKMINIQLFIRSLKISWIRRFVLQDAKWKTFIDQYLNTAETKCNCFSVGSKYIKVLYENKIKNPFWKDVFKSWFYYIEALSCENSSTEIHCQPIWFNPKLKTNFISN